MCVSETLHYPEIFAEHLIFYQPRRLFETTVYFRQTLDKL